MFKVDLLLIFAAIGAGLCVGFNLLVVRKYPDDRRRGGYVSTVIVFLVVTAALFFITSFKLFVDSAVSAYSRELTESIRKNYQDIGFVRNGLDLNKINDNLSELNSVVASLKEALPSDAELGVSEGLYNLGADFLIKRLQKTLRVVNASGKAVNSFVDENNILTVSSIINGLQRRVMRIVNIVFFITASIFVVILLVHVIKSLSIVVRERKAENNAAA